MSASWTTIDACYRLSLRAETLRRFVYGVLACWCLFSLHLVMQSAYAAQSGEANSLTGLRFGKVSFEGQSATRLVVEMRAPINAQLLLLDNPYRLVIDSTNTDWNISGLLPAGDLQRAPAIGYRFGRPVPETGRLVIELNAPAAPVRAFTLAPARDAKGELTTGHRLVIDLLDRGPTAFKVARAALKKSPYIVEAPTGQVDDANPQGLKTVQADEPSLPQVKPQRGAITNMVPPVAPPDRWVVTIDAGHGGKDPGALSKNGTREKDITLKAARYLAEELAKTGRVIPRLTRDDDRYIKLRQRINIARSQQADVFISLHADAAQTSKAYGISVFSLSDTASDKEAAYLARSENQADLIDGPDLAVEDPIAANALLRMFQRESMNESTYLANAILREVRDVRGGAKRGHRFAGFAVLKSPDVPSVLLEMGFLTNAKDEANLRKDAYLRGLAVRISRAIVRYLEESGR